ncbi:hypothetical protein [Aliiglaciecola sp. LCG003]|uniref:hypothetical protein n=1 Tax=Aliiglaciecola sp. LCG003 TaxID=3053655 RepID=UPI0025736982|nr:hypothetical protein [Aliiglaciecola sp. LCG003]WJG11007.1 hypothetical protein QR722_08280 [Aliiglaciecola sp. LCG003]
MKSNVLNIGIVLIGIVFLGGCAFKPYAIIDGTQSKESDLDNYDVSIVSIDGKIEFGKQIKNVKPGFHYINILTTKQIRSKSSKPQMFPVDAKECMRYVVTAQHTNGMSDEWEVKLLREVPILSCTPSEKTQEELQIPTYLAFTQEPVCIDKNTLTGDYSPVVLYPSLKQCVVDGQDEQAINLIQKHSIWTLSALEQNQFQQKLNAFIDTPELMQSACAFVQSIGKPNYVPTYMIEHGVKKLTEQNPDGLVSNFSEDPTWTSILNSELKCKL